MNLYAYVHNDPLNYTDPTGEWGVAGAIYGAIAGATDGFVASGGSFREKLVGVAAGAVAGGVIGFVAPQTSHMAGLAIAGAAASASGQALGSATNAAIDKGVANVSPSDVKVDAVTTVAGGLGAGVGGAVGKGVASMTSRPIIGNSLKTGGTPTAGGLTAGAVAEGAIIGSSEKMAPPVIEAASQAVDELRKQN